MVERWREVGEAERDLGGESDSNLGILSVSFTIFHTQAGTKFFDSLPSIHLESYFCPPHFDHHHLSLSKCSLFLHSFFKEIGVYLFIYFWLCCVFVSVQGLSLVAASGGHPSLRCAGLSLSRPLVEHRLQTCRLSSCGSLA